MSTNATASVCDVIDEETARPYPGGGSNTSNGSIANALALSGIARSGSGRMPNMHFEVYRSATTASTCSNRLKTSQVAYPAPLCEEAHATSGYATSASRPAAIRFATDNVFSDGVTQALAASKGR